MGIKTKNILDNQTIILIKAIVITILLIASLTRSLNRRTITIRSINIKDKTIEVTIILDVILKSM